MEKTFENEKKHKLYREVRKLGDGAFGVTYLVNSGEEQFALKAVSPRGTGTSIPAEACRELFAKEATILESLDHPKIPNFVDFFESKGELHLVQEFIDGETLFDTVYPIDPESDETGDDARYFKGIEIPRVLELVVEILEILNYLHTLPVGHRILHRDIKPENVLISPDGSTWLIDFGVSHLGPKKALTIVGTPLYVAPELMAPQLYNWRGAGPACDIYSLGAIALFALHGEASLEEVQRQLSKKIRQQDFVPQDFEDVLAKMVASQLKYRYASAVEVLHDLKRLGLVDKEYEFPVRGNQSSQTVADVEVPEKQATIVVARSAQAAVQYEASVSSEIQQSDTLIPAEDRTVDLLKMFVVYFLGTTMVVFFGLFIVAQFLQAITGPEEQNNDGASVDQSILKDTHVAVPPALSLYQHS